MSTHRIPIARETLAAAFQSCGLGRGDTVLVHSDLFLMGPMNGTPEAILATYFNAFRDVLDDAGTLVVPAYFLEHGRWETPYDIRRSPVSRELGAFPQHVVNQPGARRSPNPIYALAAVGPRAEYLCCGGTASAYGVDSPWDRLFQCDGKMAFVGIGLRAMTFVHYVEHMVGVPHLYNKFYPAPIFDNGYPVDLPVCAQVRYYDFDVSPYLEHLDEDFEKAGLVRKAEAGSGTIRCVSVRGAFDFLKEKLKKDFFYLLKHPPNFVKGERPMDGGAGPTQP